MDDNFLHGIDPMSAARADVEAEVNVRMDELLGDVSNWTPTGLLQSMTKPASGYTEIASADGIHWHARTDALPDDDDDSR